QSVVRPQRDGFLKVLNAFCQTFRGPLIPEISAGFVKILGIQMLSFFVAKLQPELVRHSARDSMMRHHQVRKFQSLLITPDACSISRVDKLSINGDHFIAAADPSNHDGTDAEFAADRAGV